MRYSLGRHLVTGSAGFIGYHLCKRLLDEGRDVVGVDAMIGAYDPALKHARLARLLQHPNYRHHAADLADPAVLTTVFDQPFARVIHLAAWPGVRLGDHHPDVYVRSNVNSMAQVLEGCRRQGVPHLLFASSSSVYGDHGRLPFTEDLATDHPRSFYAATKKAGEVMAHAWSSLFGLPVTGLRLFTVYGPYGRPDMAVFRFTRAILRDEPIQVYQGGQLKRDFTYVDDVVEAIRRLSETVPAPDPDFDPKAPRPDRSDAPFRIYNVGNQAPVGTHEVIDALEAALGRKARRVDHPQQAGDVQTTWADSSALAAATGFVPSTSLREGIFRFVRWYLEYYGESPT